MSGQLAHQAVKFSVTPIDYGSFASRDDAEFIHHLRLKAQTAIRFGNKVLSLYFANRAGALSKDEWKARLGRLQEEYKGLLSDYVRSTYYRAEVMKLRRQMTRVVNGDQSLPNLTGSRTLTLKGSGVRFERIDGKIRVALSILPRTDRLPKQPVFEIVQERLRVDNERRLGKRELGKLQFLKRIDTTLNAIVDGELPCTQADLKLGRSLKLVLHTARPVTPKQLDDDLWGLIWVRRDGEVAAKPRIVGESGDPEMRLLDKEYFYTPPDLWDYYRQSKRVYLKRYWRLRSSLEKSGASRDRLKALIGAHQRQQKHWVNVLANMIVEWVLTNRVRPVVVYEQSRTPGDSPFPPYAIVERLEKLCLEQGIEIETSPVGASVCHSCEEELYTEGGYLLCQCQL